MEVVIYNRPVIFDTVNYIDIYNKIKTLYSQTKAV